MKKLVVTNFGPVKDIDIKLRDINLFIGEQSVGKSTIAKLITILADHVNLLSIIKGGMSEWLDCLKRFNLNIYKDDPYLITYEFDEADVFFHCDISPFELSMYVILDEKKITDKDQIFHSVIGTKRIYHTESFDRYLASKEGDDNIRIKEIGNLLSNSLYIPAERIIYSLIDNLLPALALSKASIPNNLLKFMVELNNAKAEYPEFDMPLLGISYLKEGGNDFFVLKDENKKLPISAASSGIQSTMPLLQVVYYAINHKEYSTFVVEEPECNLYPEKQVELLKYIIKLIKSEGRTLTITTHSPYILSAMNNYLFAGNIAEKINERDNLSIEEILDNTMFIMPDECAVYSLGEKINGNGSYCKSLQDVTTGMIDSNSLDMISTKLSVDFERLEDVYINLLTK